MTDTALALLGGTAISVGVAIVVAAALPMAWVLAKRRFDRLEAEQAELAAHVGGELKRLGQAVARQRADQISDAINRAAQKRAPQQSHASGHPTAEAQAIHQPLRKTIH